VAVAGNLARELGVELGDVGLDHDLDQLVEGDLGLPAEQALRLRGIAL
jgi:hypothetical protein